MSMQEIKAQIEEKRKLLRQFSGPESEGLVLSVQSSISKLERQLHKMCPHANLTIKTKETYTQDSRKQKREVKECPECGFYSDNIVEEEPVSDEAIWR